MAIAGVPPADFVVRAGEKQVPRLRSGRHEKEEAAVGTSKLVP